jgi:hypothetical protein
MTKGSSEDAPATVPQRDLSVVNLKR